MRRYRRLIMVGVLVLVAATIWYSTRPGPLEVTVVPAETGLVEARVANTRAGTVKAVRRSKIAPRVSGQVTALPVAEGSRVEKGQLLLELWNDDIRAELELARARLKAAEARADEACVRVDVAEREARRLSRLHEEDSASEEARDRAVAEAQAAEAACRAARADVDVAGHEIESREAALARTRLTAPFAGVVAEVNAELGEIVTPSPPGIATPPAVDLIDASSLYVSAPIDEVDAPAVGVGMDARISLDAFRDRQFSGTVQRIAPYVLDIEKQARTVEVEVAFDESPAEDGLLPGYSADAEIITGVADDALRIPTEALIDNERVLVLNEDGIIETREVSIGLQNWEYTQIADGLDQGARVIASPRGEEIVAGAEAVAKNASEGRAP